jgi:N-methylhydantoinase A/oxoprolinase/acetone carboxylase beta subunit
MEPGARYAGPALVEERESTTVILPGDVTYVTETGHLMVDIGVEKAQ